MGPGSLPIHEPPLALTGDPRLDWLLFIVGCIVSVRIAVYWLKAAHLAREGIRRFVESVAYAAVAGGAVSFVLDGGQHPDPALSVAPAFAAVVVFLARANIGRSRYIPVAVRREVIARDLKGERFDPAKHHIDHIWPFVLGGSHTADNLRVITKEENLRKGRRRPTRREMFRD